MIPRSHLHTLQMREKKRKLNRVVCLLAKNPTNKPADSKRGYYAIQMIP